MERIFAGTMREENNTASAQPARIGAPLVLDVTSYWWAWQWGYKPHPMTFWSIPDWVRKTSDSYYGLQEFDDSNYDYEGDDENV